MRAVGISLDSSDRTLYTVAPPPGPNPMNLAITFGYSPCGISGGAMELLHSQQHPPCKPYLGSTPSRDHGSPQTPRLRRPEDPRRCSEEHGAGQAAAHELHHGLQPLGVRCAVLPGEEAGVHPLHPLDGAHGRIRLTFQDLQGTPRRRHRPGSMYDGATQRCQAVDGRVGPPSGSPRSAHPQ